MLREKTRAEISVSAIKDNYNAISEIVKSNSKEKEPVIICVVKADAYGHGVGIVSSVLDECGCNYYAVSSEDEAMELREYEIERKNNPDILILGYTFPENALEMAKNNITCAAVSYEHLCLLSEALKNSEYKLKVHIKLNTGMNRVGFDALSDEDIEKTAELIEKAHKLDNIDIKGIFTHFSCADDELLDGKTQPDGSLLTMTQYKRFIKVCDMLSERGIDLGMKHCANSAGILAFPDAYLDAVRAGVILYGMNPNGKINPSLRPVMRFVSTVGLVHTLKPSEAVSYGATYRAEREMTLATVTVGYADGYIRRYSGDMITVNGVSYPQVGRICMDQCMIDITGHENDVHAGDDAILFGDDNGARIESLARRAGTINYECTCIISKRARRVVIE